MPRFAPPPLGPPFDPSPYREIVRAVVTFATAIGFFYVVWFYLNQAATEHASTEHVEGSFTHLELAMHSIFPAVTSVLGTTLGFYFGSQKR